MDNNTPIVSAIIDEHTGRIMSVHRNGDEQNQLVKAGDAVSIVKFSKDDISRLVKTAENIPGVGNITYEK